MPPATQHFIQQMHALNSLTLNETNINHSIRPLFSRSLRASQTQIRLCNHSLGRALDQTQNDVAEGLSYWYELGDQAWEPWLMEISRYREMISQLIHAPGAMCIVPKNSAGQGLRAILNCFDNTLNVLSSSGEFNSLDHILKIYAQRDHIRLRQIQPSCPNGYRSRDVIQAMREEDHLLILSMVMFSNGQLLLDLPEIIAAAQKKNIKVLLDLYHAAGVIPVDITTLDCDFAVGGGYKYLHGGPGLCWLYIHPRYLQGKLQTLDTGWFAQPSPFTYQRPEHPELAAGGDAFLESTPAVLPFYQARAGLQFTLALGVEKLRQHNLQQQQQIQTLLSQYDIPCIGDIGARGAFLTIPHPHAQQLVDSMEQNGITCDQREGLIRLGPDLLNTDSELSIAIEQLAEAWNTLH